MLRMGKFVRHMWVKVGNLILDEALLISTYNLCFYGSYHTCDISLFRRELPIFCSFLRKSPYENFIISLYILYISLFGNPDLPTKMQKFPSCLIILPILKRKSPYLSFQVYHMYGSYHQMPTLIKLLKVLISQICSNKASVICDHTPSPNPHHSE